MNAQSPSPEEARAALSEVGHRSQEVRHSDLHLFWMLIAVVAADAVVATVFSFAPHPGSAAPLVIIGAVVVALIAAAVIGFRIRAYSRAAILVYFATIVAFNVWSALVISASVATAFFGRGQPTYHFGISEAIASIPLLIGALIIAFRSTQRQ